MSFEKIIEWTPAFDKRNSNPNKDYGIHGMNLRFLLKGEKGMTQFVIYTNWQLPHVTKEFEKEISSSQFPHLMCNPLPADFGYHAKEPQYEGQDLMECCYSESGKCYYDGSSLYAQTVFDRFVTEGDSAIWEELEKAYHERFDMVEENQNDLWFNLSRKTRAD